MQPGVRYQQQVQYQQPQHVSLGPQINPQMIHAQQIPIQPQVKQTIAIPLNYSHPVQNNPVGNSTSTNVPLNGSAANNLPINNIRKIRYDSTSKSTGETVIMDQIMRSLVSQNKEIDVDMTILASALSNLNARMTKAVMEMIFDFHSANPNNVQIMGRKDGAPYGGVYRMDSNETDFDLKIYQIAWL